MLGSVLSVLRSVLLLSSLFVLGIRCGYTPTLGTTYSVPFLVDFPAGTPDGYEWNQQVLTDITTGHQWRSPLSDPFHFFLLSPKRTALYTASDSTSSPNQPVGCLTINADFSLTVRTSPSTGDSFNDIVVSPDSKFVYATKASTVYYYKRNTGDTLTYQTFYTLPGTAVSGMSKICFLCCAWVLSNVYNSLVWYSHIMAFLFTLIKR